MCSNFDVYGFIKNAKSEYFENETQFFLQIKKITI